MKKNPGRMVSALGIGVVFGVAGWLAFNFIGIAHQFESAGSLFSVSSPESIDRGAFAPAVDDDAATAFDSVETEPASVLSESDFDREEPASSREPALPDYIAGFEAQTPSLSVRQALPNSGRIVMDPRMFVFDENDAELESAFDELMFHPDDEIRQAAIENLLPAMGR